MKYIVTDHGGNAIWFPLAFRPWAAEAQEHFEYQKGRACKVVQVSRDTAEGLVKEMLARGSSYRLT